MEKAKRERNRLYGGVSMPIECYHIRSTAVGNRTRTPHYHDHIEFLFASGDCDIEVWINGETIDFCTGELLVINANIPHTFVPRLEINRYICIKAIPDVLYYGENSLFDMKYALPFFKGNSRGYEKFSAEEIVGTNIPEVFYNAIGEWIEKAYGYEVSLKNSLLTVFLWVIRQCFEKGERVVEQKESPSKENVELIQKAAEYVNKNYAVADENSTATFINMSYSHFSRLFSSVMKISFKDYLLSVKISESEKLLLETDSPITEIALACGFSSSSHYIDRFRRIKGVTPRQYRKIWIEGQ